jgi:predicted transcriptional regulator
MIFVMKQVKLVKSRKTELIQFRVTPKMKEKLKSIAEERNTTIAAIIEDSLLRTIEETPSLEQRVHNLEEELKALRALVRKP